MSKSEARKRHAEVSGLARQFVMMNFVVRTGGNPLSLADAIYKRWRRLVSLPITKLRSREQVRQARATNARVQIRSSSPTILVCTPSYPESLPNRTPPAAVSQPPPLTISLLPYLARGNVCLMNPEVSHKPSRHHSNDAKLTDDLWRTCRNGYFALKVQTSRWVSMMSVFLLGNRAKFERLSPAVIICENRLRPIFMDDPLLSTRKGQDFEI
jgi:hypothetical protein